MDRGSWYAPRASVDTAPLTAKWEIVPPPHRFADEVGHPACYYPNGVRRSRTGSGASVSGYITAAFKSYRGCEWVPELEEPRAQSRYGHAHPRVLLANPSCGQSHFVIWFVRRATQFGWRDVSAGLSGTLVFQQGSSRCNEPANQRYRDGGQRNPSETSAFAFPADAHCDEEIVRSAERVNDE